MLLVALMVALQLFGGWSLDARSEESEKPELARLADYSRVRAPPAPKNETQEQANAKSAGCMSCHTQVDSMTMHPEGNVVLGCTDCHGGDASVHVGKELDPKSKAYAQARDQAHVLPLYPKTWGYPSSANPKQSYTLLNKESPEFVRFKNPSDYRAARDACGACHLDVVHAGERSIMATDAMLLGGASYNNGILPYKNYVLGEAYTRTGEPAKILSPGGPGQPIGTVTAKQAARGNLPALSPFPTWQVTPPADIFRVFERGGRTIGTQFPEIGNPDSNGELQKLEEPGRPEIRQSNRGPGTGLRVAIPLLNIHKTRLNDPLMWFMGTNDQPGDYRTSGCGACHVIYANDRERLGDSLTYAEFGRDGMSQSVDPDHPQERARPSAEARVHALHPDLDLHELPHAPAERLPEQLPRLHHVGLRVRSAVDVAEDAEVPHHRRAAHDPRPQPRRGGGARQVGRRQFPPQRHRPEPDPEGDPVRRLSRPRLELPRHLQARPQGQPAGQGRQDHLAGRP